MRTTTTTVAQAMQKAVARKSNPAPVAPPIKREPVQVITGRQKPNGKDDVWLSAGLTAALVKEYGDHLDHIQAGADWLVSEGYVAIPEGWTLKAFVNRRWGKVTVVAEPVGMSPKATLGGIQLPKFG